MKHFAAKDNEFSFYEVSCAWYLIYNNKRRLFLGQRRTSVLKALHYFFLLLSKKEQEKKNAFPISLHHYR